MQALISAVFSIVFQAIAQGFFPRFHVQHTSDHVSHFFVSPSLLCMRQPADHDLRLSQILTMNACDHNPCFCSTAMSAFLSCKADKDTADRPVKPKHSLLIHLCGWRSVCAGVWSGVHPCYQSRADGPYNDCCWDLSNVC